MKLCKGKIEKFCFATEDTVLRTPYGETAEKNNSKPAMIFPIST